MLKSALYQKEENDDLLQKSWGQEIHRSPLKAESQSKKKKERWITEVGGA